MLNKITLLIPLAASLLVASIPASYAAAMHHHGTRDAARTTSYIARETPAARAAFGYEPQDVQQQPQTLRWINNPDEPRG